MAKSILDLTIPDYVRGSTLYRFDEVRVITPRNYTNEESETANLVSAGMRFTGNGDNRNNLLFIRDRGEAIVSAHAQKIFLQTQGGKPPWVRLDTGLWAPERDNWIYSDHAYYDQQLRCDTEATITGVAYSPNPSFAPTCPHITKTVNSLDERYEFFECSSTASAQAAIWGVPKFTVRRGREGAIIFILGGTEREKASLEFVEWTVRTPDDRFRHTSGKLYVNMGRYTTPRSYGNLWQPNTRVVLTVGYKRFDDAVAMGGNPLPAGFGSPPPRSRTQIILPR